MTIRTKSSPARYLVFLLAAVLVATGFSALSTTAANAARTCVEYKAVKLDNGDIVNTCVKYSGGSTGDNSETGPVGPPPCNLDEAPYTEFCSGTSACWGNDPAAVQKPKELEGVPKPEEDSHVVYKECRRQDGSIFDLWSWSTKAGPSVADRITTARGLLKAPVFTASFNPPTRTIVNLPTWWWAEGAPTGRIVGTPAFGVVAIATPNRMIVDPGDGSGAFSCPISTTKSDACSYTYRRASNLGSVRGADDARAYPAEVRLVYDVSFEDNGRPLDVAGLPPEVYILAGSDTVNVVVREVQSRVTRIH